MMAARDASRLIDRLPPVRGRLAANAPLAATTWFRVGGPAEILFRPADEADLAQFIAGLPRDVPLTVIGVGSNLLVRDGGVPGVVIRLGRGFTDIAIEGETVTAGAGMLDRNVALSAAEAGLAGLEFLIGVPGTIGGAIAMNAGAYGAEIKDVIVAARGVTREGSAIEFTAVELKLSYRHSPLAGDVIFTQATLRGRAGEKAAIAARMAEIDAAREATQPVRTRTGGSTFANLDDGRKAWQLIDAVGGRGLRVGGAQVSEKHCNFLINTGDATAADIEALGEELRRRVADKFGATLRWEIRRIGVPKAVA